MLAFLGGTLSPDARSNVEQHVARCTACADLITWAAAADQASATGSPGETGRPFIGQLQPGTRVGRYQILGAVGRGGMGEVYAAYHPELDRRIALKVVQGLEGGSGQRHARLLREARAIARLSHPNIITVHDAGRFGDRVFIAMELIDGLTIDQWLGAGERTWQEVLNIFIAAARGLAAAHAAGVIHRDFKPQNVMIARDGTVRVMDFGLARLEQEDIGAPQEVAEDDSTMAIATVTKTGAFIGTPAYMSPEQFRREAIDARSDQFSFSVALHEALFGSRPSTAVAGTEDSTVDMFKPSRSNVPGWLGHVVKRGASADREQRYPSMNVLLTALARARSRTRRRLLAVAAAVTVLLLSGGGWRLAHGNRFVCAVPKDRVAAAWALGDTTDARRQSMHRAFAASGRATAETSWQRVSKVLDEYMSAWSAMYLQACEATHVRGEQSNDILDLRMACLNDNLDQVRALTDTLATADGTVVSRAVTAAVDLTSVNRCANVSLLKSAVPLPRDERTLREVQRLRRVLTDVDTLRDVGRVHVAFEKAVALRSQVEATGFKPLLGELFQKIGTIQTELFDSGAEKTLEDAVFAAEASHDDLTAAKAATDLIYVVGTTMGRSHDSERWARLANAILDRLGPGHSRTRAWALQNEAMVLCGEGKFEPAVAMFERAVVLKEKELGREHPDVAKSLCSIAWPLSELGRPHEALTYIDRALAIQETCCEPNGTLGLTLSNKGALLHQLRSNDEAKRAFRNAIHVLESALDTEHPSYATAVEGLGEIELEEGRAESAIPLLERATRLYGQHPGVRPLLARARFTLARALWTSGTDRRRSLRLATKAREDFAASNRAKQEHDVAAWLSRRRGS